MHPQEDCTEKIWRAPSPRFMIRTTTGIAASAAAVASPKSIRLGRTSIAGNISRRPECCPHPGASPPAKGSITRIQAFFLSLSRYTPAAAARTADAARPPIRAMDHRPKPRESTASSGIGLSEMATGPPRPDRPERIKSGLPQFRGISEINTIFGDVVDVDEVPLLE